MELQKFVKDFAAQFEETESGLFAAGTYIRSLEEWSSLMAFSIIAMVDEMYNVKIKGDDIRNCQTIEDIYNIVKSRLK
jgi:acyl carrier protein